MKVVLMPIKSLTFVSRFDLLSDLNLICYSVVNDGFLRGPTSCRSCARYCVHSCYHLLDTWSQD